MEAGQGAAEQAQRIGVRIARLEAELEQARKAQQAWLAGADGEARVGEQLRQLEVHGWKMLHDVHWPGRPKANIDHIAIGPGGVLVIDDKNWSGDVQLRDGELTRNGYARNRETSSALDQCAAVAALLEPQHRSMTQAWICLVGQPDVAGLAGSGVAVVGIDTLVERVVALPPVLENPFVEAIHGYLVGLLAGATSPVVATTALLDRADAASSVLAARRASASRAASTGRPRVDRAVRSERPAQRRRNSQPSCLGAVWRLVVIALVLWFGAGALQYVVGSFPTPPVPPSPEIVQPDTGG
ncbi:hypothetical protein MN0502_07180 [Arthrobacter sp. MN05-02]|nr:hypothetical protein MN0502_07180 [Arthrobacter sp. MN05-02]